MKILTFFCFLLVCLLQFQLWLGQGGIIEIFQLKQAYRIQLKENAVLKFRNDTLAAEVLDLKVGMAAIEERARNDLGMIKQGETFYQVIF